ERGCEGVADRLQIDTVEDVLEEAAHDQPLSLRARETARHEVEELLAIDLPERRPVGTADVVRKDLEPGNRVRVRGLREQEVAVLLVGVGLLRVLLDADHPSPYRPSLVPEHAFEGEVRGSRGSNVLLERVVVE